MKPVPPRTRRRRDTLVASALAVAAALGGFLTAAGPWSRLHDDKPVTGAFRVIISQYGMPGDPATYWSISSDGLLVIEAEQADSMGTKETLQLDSMGVARVRDTLESVIAAEGRYESPVQIHNHLSVTIQLANGVEHHLDTKNVKVKALEDLIAAVDHPLDEDWRIDYRVY